MSNSDKSDHNQRFEKILNNSSELLKEDPWLLQNHLDVKQILHFVKNEQVDVLEVLLQNHSRLPNDSTRSLVEMVVVGGIFYEQNPKLLMRLEPLLQQKDFSVYIQHIKGAPKHDFLQYIEPNVVLPSGKADVDEALTALRSKRMLNHHLDPTQHCSSIKKM